MTQDEIKELAGHRDVSPWIIKLVGDAVAKEREACAKVCDPYVNSSSDHEAGAAINIQDAIRLRGEA
jgi:hypothetical protein